MNVELTKSNVNGIKEEVRKELLAKAEYKSFGVDGIAQIPVKVLPRYISKEYRFERYIPTSVALSNYKLFLLKKGKIKTRKISLICKFLEN